MSNKESKDRVLVNRPALPDFQTYVDLLRGVWERAYLTNNGPLLVELEGRLKRELNVRNIVLTANCTQALEMMIHACARSGRKKVLTTPFSFIATLSSVLWTGFDPVFIDIDPVTMNLSAKLLQAALDDSVACVLATHLYGRPADDGTLESLCAAQGIPLLFDGAHAFGIETDRGPLVNQGMACALSFHATKVFGTVEGGAVVTNNLELAHKADALRSFGAIRGGTPTSLGTNSKMSEVHAAFGLASLPGLAKSIETRQRLWRRYRDLLPKNLNLIDLEATPVTKSNYSYAVVIFPSESALLSTKTSLAESDIDTRRYFHPALSELPFVSAQSTPIANNLSRRVLCLPLYASLAMSDVEKICDLLNKCAKDFR